MQKIRIAQQYVATAQNNGLKSEYCALTRRKALTERYEFLPAVLHDCHTGLSLRDIRFYRKAFREAKPDIIHIRGAGMESLNAVLAAKLTPKAKILMTVHGMFSDIVYYSPVKRWIFAHVIEPLIFGLSDGISCVCEAAAARDRFRRYRRKMLPCVYNRMPCYPEKNPEKAAGLRRAFSIPDDAVAGIYVGRITKEKGLSFLADALQALDEDWPKGLYLLILGEGEYRTELKSRCALLRHRAHVVIPGQRDDVGDCLQACDFFLSPSLHENLSISILEACAAGLPCLVTDVGGNPEMVQEGENGSLIPPASADAIAAGLRRFCDPAYRTRLAASAKQKDFSRYSDARVDRQLSAVYEKLLSG